MNFFYFELFETIAKSCLQNLVVTRLGPMRARVGVMIDSNVLNPISLNGCVFDTTAPSARPLPFRQSLCCFLEF